MPKTPIKKNKYGVKCPKCRTQEIWKVGYMPTKAGRKDRFKCTRCATTFYKGQPGTLARKLAKKKGG